MQQQKAGIVVKKTTKIRAVLNRQHQKKNERKMK